MVTFRRLDGHCQFKNLLISFKRGAQYKNIITYPNLKCKKKKIFSLLIIHSLASHIFTLTANLMKSISSFTQLKRKKRNLVTLHKSMILYSNKQMEN